MNYLFPYLFLAVVSALGLKHHSRCRPSDPCWPSSETWSAFNATISGRLLRSYPSASSCHTPNYNHDLCATVQQNWTSSFWRTSQPGAYAGILWELGADQCLPFTPALFSCGQGLVALYTVAAKSAQDVQSALRFARKHNLDVAVKNTGHDHLGRSSGAGFAIWTHNMKGRVWASEFVPQNATYGTEGVQAVTVRAGEQWWEVYGDADTRGRIVVGGMARTVGAAGGYLTGGGHSPFANRYGLAVDNLLQVELVTPTGKLKTLNMYTDPEYFRAIRGGAGSAWGIILSATYRTHLAPTGIQVALMQFNATTPSALRKIYTTVFQTLPAITNTGWTGYSLLNAGFSGIFLLPDGTDSSFNIFSPLLNLQNTTGVESQAGTFPLPSWKAYRETFLSDPNIATNIVGASRLLTDKILTNASAVKDLVDLTISHRDGGAFNFVGKVKDTREETSVHPIWRRSAALLSFGVDWEDDAEENVKRREKMRLMELGERLGRIVRNAEEEEGTYVNEANPWERRWKEVFWGREGYERLERMKGMVDPDGRLGCNRCVGGEVVYEI